MLILFLTLTLSSDVRQKNCPENFSGIFPENICGIFWKIFNIFPELEYYSIKNLKCIIMLKHHSNLI